MKHVRLTQVNGLWYPETLYSIKLLTNIGVDATKGYKLAFIANELAKHNIGIKVTLGNV